MIEFLNWDSHFFNIKIGKVDLTKPDINHVKAIFNEKISGDYDLVYLFTSTISSEIDALIRQAGGLLTDQKITYIKEVSEIKPHELPNQINNYDGALTPELLKLALESGHASRFNNDTRLQPKFELLYKTWIEKSLTGEMADRVLVYEDAHRIKAFVTLKKKAECGQIGLIAVNPELQGKGVGQALMLVADNWYSSESLKTARVVTQQANTAACRLYERSGYSIEKSECVYHL